MTNLSPELGLTKEKLVEDSGRFWSFVNLLYRESPNGGRSLATASGGKGKAYILRTQNIGIYEIVFSFSLSTAATAVVVVMLYQ